MSFRMFGDSTPHHFRAVVQSFLQRDELAFSEVLSETEIATAFEEEGVSFTQDDDVVYSPQVTLWAFLSQAVFKGEHRSCVAAVARIAVLMVTFGRRISGDTGAYCRARAQLPEPVLERLAVQVATDCEADVSEDWMWCKRHVHLVDGTTLSMSDTPKNQVARRNGCRGQAWFSVFRRRRLTLVMCPR